MVGGTVWSLNVLGAYLDANRGKGKISRAATRKKQNGGLLVIVRRRLPLRSQDPHHPSFSTFSTFIAFEL
jgi:hypothetical protein